MELRHLRYFVAVAEELNFSRASRRLHVSQPPLSRQIRDLEDELGIPLFDRARNKVRLTAAGQFFFDGAQRLLEQCEELVERTRKISQRQRKQLHIGYIANVHGKLVIDSATRFRKAIPDVTVRVFDLSASDQVAAIVAGKLDLGFVGFAEGALQEGLSVARIGSTFAVVALARGHPLAKKQPASLSAFKDEPFVTISEHAFPGAQQFMLRACEAAGFKPRIVHEAVQPIDILNLVALGVGVALVPERMRQVPHPGVVFRSLPKPVLQADSYVAWKDSNASDLLPDFVKAAKAAYMEIMRQAPRAAANPG